MRCNMKKQIITAGTALEAGQTRRLATTREDQTKNSRTAASTSPWVGQPQWQATAPEDLTKQRMTAANRALQASRTP